MKRCKILLSVHGGAVGNMIWMSRGSSIIELIPTNELKERPCFYYLSESLGLKYVNIEPDIFGFDALDVRVDVDKVMK